MNKPEQFIKAQLETRAQHGLLRKLSTDQFPIDFCSNDYLGFARSALLKKMTEDILSTIPQYKNGSTGSRLLTGNHLFTEDTERAIAYFHQAESALFFNSGYDANIGLLSALPQRGDTIIADELIHASLIDGARLSHANRYTFRHNDLEHLESKLKIAGGNTYVVVESVYSMDGDIAPLREIAELCENYRAALIVDEAHATGIFGLHGRGLICEMELQNIVFARIITFGKAMGTHGAVVLGSEGLREYLINFARSFVYTTAPTPHHIASVKAAYQLLQKSNYPELIRERIAFFNKIAGEAGLRCDLGRSPIKSFLCPGNANARAAAFSLQKIGMDVRAILSPTIPEGQERLRICLHLFNTDQEIMQLTDTLKRVQNT